MKASSHTYVLRPIHRGRVEVVKFDDYETLPIDVYTVEGSRCSCPAHTPWCRHKAMIQEVVDRGLPLEGAIVDWDNRVIRRMPEPLLITRNGETHIREGTI